MDKLLVRINELCNKAKTEALTPEEVTEQKKIKRRLYKTI